MDSVGTILFLLLAVVVSGKLARLTRAPLPLVQIVLGVAVALSMAPTVTLDPEIFFVLFLPPLLFLDGWRIPKDDLLRDRSTIIELALGLVILTVLGVGLFIHWLIPAMPLPVAFALAAVVSPTDPIAVSAIAARTRSAVPTGTVDLSTTTSGRCRCQPMVRATARTYCRSALPSSSGGVPTAMNTTSAWAIASAASVVKCRRPEAWLALTIGSNPGS